MEHCVGVIVIDVGHDSFQRSAALEARVGGLEIHPNFPIGKKLVGLGRRPAKVEVEKKRYRGAGRWRNLEMLPI